MNFDKLKIRPSELGKLMVGLDKPNLTENQANELNTLLAKEKRTEIQQAKLDDLQAKLKAPPQLSAGAITYVHELVEAKVYKYKKSLDTKEASKGLTCESEAINYLNENLFENYTKVVEAKYENEWLISIGCDIMKGKVVRDLKCSWNKSTHPKTWEQAHSSLYEWQGRAYMMLFDCDVFYLDYVLIDTPPELIGWEDPSLHEMHDLTYEQRHTSVRYKRDIELEKLIPIAVKLARIEANKYYDEITTKRTNY